MVITHAVQIGQKMENENQPVLGGKPAAKEQPIWATEKPAAEEAPAEPSVLDQPAIEEAPAEPAVEQPAEPVVEQPAEEPAPVEEPVAEEPVAEEPVAEQPTVAEQPAVADKPKKKKSKAWIFILIALLLIGAGVAVFFLFFFNKGGEELSFEKKEPVPEAYSAVEKLAIDFEAGAITADEYVKQLTYTEFNSSKLDKKYKSDEGAAEGFSNLDEIISIMKEHASEISTPVKEELAKHVFLKDVTFGKKETTSKADGSNIVLAAKVEESYLHKLDKVVMSSNGNFLIWYTEDGDDKITSAQAKKLGESLESSITEYSKLVGLPYAFVPWVHDESNGGMEIMKERLAAESNIPNDKVKTAMSVYVMDTKSDTVLATYFHMNCANGSTTCDIAYVLGDLFDQYSSGAVTSPYILVNNKSFASSNDEAAQVINHELFHHFQFKMICVTNSPLYNTCPKTAENGTYSEAMANYFSARVSSGTDDDYILNHWSGRYAMEMSSTLSLLTKSSGGYGQWPYLLSYASLATDGLKNIIAAQKQENPYAYLNEKTSKAEKRKIINDAASKALIKNYELDPAKNTKSVEYENDSDENFDLKFSIGGGAVQFFSLGQNWSVVFTDTDSYGSAILFGKNDGKYSILKTVEGSTSFESGSFSGYSDFVLAITNADITNDHYYQLKYTQKDDPNAISLRHRYNNYAVEYEMSINMMGITTTATGKGRVDERHQRSYLETNMKTLMGIEANMITYSDFYNGVDYYTNPKDMFDGTGLGGLIRLFTEDEGEESAKWLKTNTASHTIDIDLVARKLRDAKQTQKVGDGHYKVKMTAKEMNDLMNTANSADAKNKTQYEFKNGTIEVDVYISEFGYISKLDYDFSSLVEGIDKFTCTMKLSDYNRAGDVLIPESVRYGATEEQL